MRPLGMQLTDNYMTDSFSTPADYLGYLQKRYGKIYSSGSPDPEFARITDAELQKIGSSLLKLGQFGGLHAAMEGLKNDLFPALDQNELHRISADIAIGLLPSGEANAFIAKSPDGKYALVFCSGLMLLLHKYLKLVRGFVTPEEVVHCNRKEPSKLSKDDLSAYIRDLIGAYREHGVPYGPMIKLSDRANAEHSLLLHLAEVFILCHELGHYFNGDLADAVAYSALLPGVAGQRYEENKNHEIEYRADIKGFDLYLRLLKRRGVDASSVEWLKPILATFDLFYALAGGASSTHPHPYDRVVRIVTHHYGLNTGQQIATALDNPDLFPTFFKQGGA